MEPVKNPISIEELKMEAEIFLQAGRRYWEVAHKAGIYGAIIWCDDTTGFGALFSRGEYREQMLYNIGCYGKRHSFGSVDDTND